MSEVPKMVVSININSLTQLSESLSERADPNLVPTFFANGLWVKVLDSISVEYM